MCLLCDTARKSRQRLAGAPTQAVRPVRAALPAAPVPAAPPLLKLIRTG